MRPELTHYQNSRAPRCSIIVCWGPIIKNGNSDLFQNVFTKFNFFFKILTLKGLNITKNTSFCSFFFDDVPPPLWGLKKMYILSKGKTNFLIKNPARSSPLIFFTNFWNLKPPPPPPIREKKLKKFLRMKISKFLKLPLRRYEFLNFGNLWSYYSGLGERGGGRLKKFFEKVLHQD